MLNLLLIALAISLGMGMVSFLEEQLKDEEEMDLTRHLVITVMTFVMSLGGLMFLKSIRE